MSRSPGRFTERGLNA